MSSNGFNENKYTNSLTGSTEKVNSFLNDLRDLLNKHNVKLYGEYCEVYMKNQGFLGYLEDNIETVEITDNDKSLYSSYKCLIKDN